MRALQAGGHAAAVAGGIENDIKSVIRRQALAKLHLGVMASHKLAAMGLLFEYGEIGPGQAGKLKHRQSDGTSADDEYTFIGLELRTLHGVAANGQSLHQGHGFQAKGLLQEGGGRGVKFGRWKAEALAHAAVAVHAEHLQGFAAVAAPTQAGAALSTIQIRLNAANRAHLQA
jgi:hypothetical protein